MAEWWEVSGGGGDGGSASLDQCFRKVTFELRSEREDLSQEYPQQLEGHWVGGEWQKTRVTAAQVGAEEYEARPAISGGPSMSR